MATWYTKDHEWVRIDGDVATVGITEHAQEQLGEIYAPIGGEVTEGNAAVVEDPSLVNRGAEGDGWFFKLRIADAGEAEGLMDRAAYDAYLESIA